MGEDSFWAILVVIAGHTLNCMYLVFDSGVHNYNTVQMLDLAW